MEISGSVLSFKPSKFHVFSHNPLVSLVMGHSGLRMLRESSHNDNFQKMQFECFELQNSSESKFLHQSKS